MFQGEENTYTVEGSSRGVKIGLPATVTLTSPNPDEFPLPDRRYLALHAACAKVVLLSGAVEYIHKTLRDREKTQVLSEDGSSAELLGSLLSGSSVLVH